MLTFAKTFLYFDIPTWSRMLNYGFLSLFSTLKLIYVLVIINSVSKDFCTIVSSYMYFVFDHFSNFLDCFSNFRKGSTITWSKSCLPHAEWWLRQQISGITNLLTTIFTDYFIHFLSQNKISSNASIYSKDFWSLILIHIWLLLLINSRFFSTPDFTY